MKKVVIPFLLVLSFCIYLIFKNGDIYGKTDKFYSSPKGFILYLNNALEGSYTDRQAYYNIPSEYNLDGDYSYTYSMGLIKIIDKFGSEKIKLEISNYDSVYFFDAIIRSRKK